MLPFNCPEYKQSVEHCDLQLKKLSTKDIEVGCTYRNKDHQEVMYLGKHTWFDEKADRAYGWSNTITGKKLHVFIYLDDKKNKRDKYWLQSGFTKLAERTSDKAIPSYADEFEKLIKSRYVSKPVKFVLEDATVNIDKNHWYSGYRDICVFYNDKYYIGNVNEWHERGGGFSNWSVKPDKGIKKYEIACDKVAEIKNGEYRESPCAPRNEPYDTRNRYGFYKPNLTVEEVKVLVKDLYIECENGAKYKVGG